MTNTIHIPWFHYFANRGLRVLFPVVLKLSVEGLERIPRQGPLIVAMNHTCFLDPVLGVAYVRPDVLPMAKAELFNFPYGLVFRNYGAFPVRRGDGDLSAMRRALQILREGHAMLISPEGTRTKSGVLEAAREGTALIALKSGAPILPVAMWGGKEFWRNLKRLRRTPVGMRVGDPLAIAPLEGKPTREVLRVITRELMYYIARLLPPEYRGQYSDAERMTPRYIRLQHEASTTANWQAQREVIAMQS